MTTRPVVSRDEWIEARRQHLDREKTFTRLRDELTAERRKLPWQRIDKPYTFDTTTGRKTLAELFAGCRQLLVYHFMFGPDWDEGCPSCSFWADNYNGTDVHLRHRDIQLVAVSNTSLEKITAYKKRMGWTFEWASSLGSDFNRDFDVTFSDEERQAGAIFYNFTDTTFPADEAPGTSVFYKDDDEAIYRTYSTYARGLDMLNSAYHMIDLTPLGRGEENERNMYWLRRRDQYED